MTKSGNKGKTGWTKSSYKPATRSGGHKVCSKKRTVLKDRIRALESRLLTLVAHVSTIESLLGVDADQIIASGGVLRQLNSAKSSHDAALARSSDSRRKIVAEEE